MRYIYIIAGLVFLFNPCVNIVDFLPDFFGCLLIFAGLYKMSFLIDEIADARSDFAKLMLLYGAKLVCVAFIAAGDDTLMLVFTFSFAVLEIFLMIPAFEKFISGLTFAATKYDGTAALKNAAKVKSLTNSFIVIRALMAVLPEFTSLSMYDNLGEVTAKSVNIYDYKQYFIVLAFTVALITGIVWLVRIVRYFTGVSRDDTFNEAVANDFDTRIKPDENLFTRLSMRTAAYMLGAFALASFDLILDDINYIPDFIAAAFLIIAAVVIYKNGVKNKLSVVVPCVYCAFSLAAWIYNVVFVETYGTERVTHVAEAESMYSIVTAFSVIEAVLLAAAVLLVLANLTQTLNIHIPKLTGADLHDKSRIDTLTGEFLRSSSIYINVLSAATVAMAITGAVYTIFVISFEEIWMVQSAVSIIFIFVMIKFMMNLCETLYYKKPRI